MQVLELKKKVYNMEKNKKIELDKKIQELEQEIMSLKTENKLLELDILKKKLIIEKLELEQMK